MGINNAISRRLLDSKICDALFLSEEDACDVLAKVKDLRFSKFRNNGSLLDVSELDEEELEKALNVISPLDQEHRVLVAWVSLGVVVRMCWSDFSSKLTDLWYPSSDDIWLTDSNYTWLLEVSHEEEIRFFQH